MREKKAQIFSESLNVIQITRHIINHQTEARRIAILITSDLTDQKNFNRSFKPKGE